MARETAPRKPTPIPLPARFAPAPWLAPAVLVLLVLAVQRQTLGTYFALDDLILFQQSAGIRPWPLTLWRWLSGWAWFRAVVPLWGHEPFPYHAASLVLDVVNVLLLHRLARHWGASPVAAFVGAGLFAASRLHFPALFAITSVGELLSLTFTLAALLVTGPGPRGVAALAVFALALSAKESVLLVPLAALLATPGGRPWRERVRASAPLVAGGLVLGGALLASGLGSGRLGGQAYAVSFGANLAENIARLFGWTIDLVDPIPDLHAATEGVARWLLPVLAVALSLLPFRLRGLRDDSLLRTGTVWWWLAVLPVLPLPGRTYLHYLYVPLAGAALAAAALWDRGLARWAARARARPGPGRQRWLVALAAVVAYGVWSDVLISLRMDLRMTSTDWPLDPVLRKSEIARRGVGDVQKVLGRRHANVVILIPASISQDVNLGSGSISAGAPVRHYALEDVLDEGRSLRALVPAVDSAVFAHDYAPGYVGWACFLSRSDSHLVPLGALPGAHARFVEAMLASQLPAAALDYADKALRDAPEDAGMRALRERAAAALPR